MLLEALHRYYLSLLQIFIKASEGGNGELQCISVLNAELNCSYPCIYGKTILLWFLFNTKAKENLI